MEACAKRYAEELEGRVPFVIGEEWCLKYDLEDWCDRTQTWSGPTSDCGCENCERYGRWMDGKEIYVCCA